MRGRCPIGSVYICADPRVSFFFCFSVNILFRGKRRPVDCCDISPCMGSEKLRVCLSTVHTDPVRTDIEIITVHIVYSPPASFHPSDANCRSAPPGVHVHRVGDILISDSASFRQWGTFHPFPAIFSLIRTALQNQGAVWFPADEYHRFIILKITILIGIIRKIFMKQILQEFKLIVFCICNTYQADQN